jgi:chromosome partitioning protein
VIAKVFACCNQKGGTSKTLTCVNLGIGLARQGKKVALIDLDSQAHLTRSLGYQQPEIISITLTSVLAKIMEGKLPDNDEGILHHCEDVDLMPANIELAGLEIMLVNFEKRESILKKYIDSLRGEYEYIILDCSPNMGMLTINALAAADEVLIPVQSHYLPVAGMELLLKTIIKVKRNINPKLLIAGILITMADMRTNFAKEIVELIHKTFGGTIRVFEQVIPYSIRAAESSAKGTSIYLHAPRCAVAKAYELLTKEILAS